MKLYVLIFFASLAQPASARDFPGPVCVKINGIEKGDCHAFLASQGDEK